MELVEQHNLILRITEYAVNRSSFIYTEMKDALGLNIDEDAFIQAYCITYSRETENPNHIFVQTNYSSSGGWMHSRYRLLPTAFYNYVDYVEIKVARQQATDAKHQSSLALMVAVGSLVIGSFIGLLGIITQLLLTN